MRNPRMEYRTRVILGTFQTFYVFLGQHSQKTIRGRRASNTKIFPRAVDQNIIVKKYSKKSNKMEEDELSVERICRTCLSTSTGPLELMHSEVENSNYAKMLMETFGKIVNKLESN